MGYTFYSCLAFLTPESVADLAVLKNKIQAAFAQLNQVPKPTLTLVGDELRISFGAYRFHIYYATETHVHEEAIELAANNPVDLADQPIDPARLRSCTRRFELRGDPDPDMEYFNDSLTILAAMEELDGILVLQTG